MPSCFSPVALVRKFKRSRKSPAEKASYTNQVGIALEPAVHADGVGAPTSVPTTVPHTDQAEGALEGPVQPNESPAAAPVEPSTGVRPVTSSIVAVSNKDPSQPLQIVHPSSSNIPVEADSPQPIGGHDFSIQAATTTAEPDPPQSRADMVLPALKIGLGVLQGVLSDFSLPGGFACNVIIQVIDKLNEMKSNSTALRSLLSHCNRISQVISRIGNARIPIPPEVTRALENLNRELLRVVDSDLGEERSAWLRFIKSGQDAERITEEFDEVGRLMTEFVSNVTIDSWLFTQNEGQANRIDKITHVAAAYDDFKITGRVAVCLKGTRTALCDEILDWARSSSEKSIYLLVGHPGFGKSTVARTIAERADLALNLGASFFFSRNEADLQRSTNFVNTLAYQLCMHEPMFADAVSEALKSPGTKNALTKDPSVQYRYLISGPLAPFARPNAKNPAPPLVLIVVDGLDECEDNDLVWQNLCQLVKDLPFVKVLLTSRPSRQLSVLVQNAQALLHVKEVHITRSDPDIMAFLTDQLKVNVPPEFHEDFNDWTASAEELHRLKNMSAGLFLVAATAVRYIRHSKLTTNPSKRILELVEKSDTINTYLAAIDHTYETVLSNSLDLEHQGVKEQYSAIVGAIVSLKEQLLLDDLARLIDIPVAEIKTMLRRLQAIFTIDENDKPRFHQSFVEYMQNKKRSGKVFIRDAEANLALQCLHVLDRSIHSHNAKKVCDGTLFSYAFNRAYHHLAGADRSIMLPKLSEFTRGLPGFWTNVAIYKNLRFHSRLAIQLALVSVHTNFNIPFGLDGAISSAITWKPPKSKKPTAGSPSGGESSTQTSETPVENATPKVDPFISPPGDIISLVISFRPGDEQMDHIWSDLEQARRIEAMDLYFKPVDISMEGDLRSILKSPLLTQHSDTSCQESLWLKYAEVLLLCLGVNPVWQEDWMPLPTSKDRSGPVAVDGFIREVVDMSTPKPSRISQQAIAILRQKLLETWPLVNERGSSENQEIVR